MLPSSILQMAEGGFGCTDSETDRVHRHSSLYSRHSRVSLSWMRVSMVTFIVQSSACLYLVIAINNNTVLIIYSSAFVRGLLPSYNYRNPNCNALLPVSETEQHKYCINYRWSFNWGMYCISVRAKWVLSRISYVYLPNVPSNSMFIASLDVVTDKTVIITHILWKLWEWLRILLYV
jgi:hypothetical protein